ncbi:MAG: inorganic diphosphatase [Actinobacteria bacterium]|nr:inorganic diphosphatase [Cyanobacteriota bacterium]MCL5771193.1 inorganic diphosphatase [Actinomycetota bacterium]
MEKIFPNVVNVIVEVPKGSRNKYEYDPINKRIKLDRVLFSAVHYPADYGYIENTLAEDGDEVDVLVLISEPTFPGCLIEAKPIGVLKMRDEKGIDNKILAVPLKDPLYQHINDIHDIAPHLLSEIENFFMTYKKLEAKVVETDGWSDLKKTLEYLNKTKK